MQDLLKREAPGRALREGPGDRTFEAWGYRSFWIALPTVPAEFITEELGKDRKDLFPVFARPDFATLRPNALSELRAMLHTAEHDFLAHTAGPFTNGAECSLADIHAIWMLKWALQTIGVAQEPGFGPEAFPRVHRWCDALPPHTPPTGSGLTLPPEEASARLLASAPACPDIGVDATDPLHLSVGDAVAVEMTDATPGYCPQEGTLIGLSMTRIVLGLENGLRVHFPRVGYAVRRVGEGVG
ncbi:hypothetical protein LTR53_017563 [Teratosphaeriaceae sp. CCFEE 6253]|nr:hypothetical protein LTR53_017563 [Teratosphaeriaceae sp. CCFEE 6253]